MKKINLKNTIFAVSLVLVTGFSTYALANMGFSHMGGGYSGNNYAINHANDYNNNHMGSGNGHGMGFGQHMNNGNHYYHSGHMFNNQENCTQNFKNNDMNKSGNDYTPNDNTSDSKEE